MHPLIAASGVVVAESAISNRGASGQMKMKTSVSIGVGPATFDEHLSQSSDDDEALGLMQKHQRQQSAVAVISERP
jgi:uncharacterized protein (DUF111 family)